jgi:hypothetical protein
MLAQMSISAYFPDPEKDGNPFVRSEFCDVGHVEG